MTVDLLDLADALRWGLILAAIIWTAYAWRNRIEYRRAVWFLFALAAADWLAHALANWAEQPDSAIPSEFSIFSVYVVLGALAGLVSSLLYARHIRLSAGSLLGPALVAVLAGGAGARAYQLWMHWDYYSQNVDDILNLRQGGMGLRGGIVIAVLGLLLWVLVRRSFQRGGETAFGSRSPSFWDLVDAGALGLSLAQSISWYGAHLIGANYGAASDAWFAQELPDAYGIIAPRIPVQLLAVAFFGLLFLALVRLGARRMPVPGSLFLTYLLVSGLGGFALGSWRADETLYWGGWRVDQLVDLSLAGVGLLLLGLRALAGRRRPASRLAAPLTAEGG